MKKESYELQFENADANGYVRAKTDELVLFCHVFHSPFVGFEPKAKFIEITKGAVLVSKNFEVSNKGKKFHRILNAMKKSGEWKKTAKLYDRSKIKSLRIVIEEVYPKDGLTYYYTHAHHVVMDYGNTSVKLNYDFKKGWMGITRSSRWSYWSSEAAGDMHRSLVHAMNVLMPMQVPHATGGVLVVSENENEDKDASSQKDIF